MTNEEAKSILQAWRSDMADEPPPEVREALARLDGNRELSDWWEKEQQLDAKLEEAFHHSPVPPDLKDRILSHRNPENRISENREAANNRSKLISFPRLLPMAASFIALLFVGVLLFDPLPAEAEPELDDYIDHLSSYEIDPEKTLRTSDPNLVLSELRKRIGSAPDHFPNRMHDLQPTAVHCSNWRGAVVGVVVMRDPQGTLCQLYLVESSQFPDRSKHPVQPEMRQIQNQALLVWSEQAFLYALAGPRALDFVNQ